MKKTTKNREAIQSFVLNHLYHIRYVAGLDDFNIMVCSPKKKTKKERKEKHPAIMQIEVRYDYLDARITVHDDVLSGLWKNKEYKQILEVTCHEVAHIITTEAFDELKIPYKGRGRILLERLTERTGRLIYRLYVKYMKECSIDIRTGLDIKK